MAKAKSHQKKFDTRIDFTPMVDMNMLLITFFMLCTTMIKSQTMAIALPSNDNDIKQEDMNKAEESKALTIIIDGEVKASAQGDSICDLEKGRVFFFEGKAPTKDQIDQFIADKTFDEVKFGVGEGTIREVIRKKNKKIVAEIEKLKADWREKKFSEDEKLNDSIYHAKAKVIRNNDDLDPPVVIIKATGRASYSNVLNVLDEMQINNISRYQIDRMKDVDTLLIEKKTGKPLK